MASVKSWLKFVVHSVLAGYAFLRIKSLLRPTLIILTYHRVLPTKDQHRDSEQPGMVVSPQLFQLHLRTMQRLGATFMHLDDWIALDQEGKPVPKLTVAVTFDDGWRDNYEHAYPILHQQKVPFTIFLVTNAIGQGQAFWPERVMQLVMNHGALTIDRPEFDWLRPHLTGLPLAERPLTREEADRVVSNLKQLDDQSIIAGLETTSLARTDPATDSPRRVILDLNELQEMHASGLAHYGGHTRHHFRLNRLNSTHALMDEIAGCQQDLQALKLQPAKTFCYPNGDISEYGEVLVRQHFHGACTTRSGCNASGCDPFTLKRYNLHDNNSGSARSFLATLGRGLL
ncbi:polysaccharide deacetylase family protein [Marinobacter sp. SS21]|uniref:polysaccharide deacetylase family protein n=1 Tax=Marinobacter sp. SS21 TaxID=2979460 RepID=UPI00232B9D73|nr:polysaccharide deacetylase family protein [Marinobacter sp. SS21]MDC0661938.1 polysaccharide deacetylase family protein [Marinobacter sp. SS21]